MPVLPAPIEEGLVLRRATAADIPRIVELHAASRGVAVDSGRMVADEHQMRDLLEHPHPTFSGSEMTVVKESSTGRLVSSQHLSHHTWAYDGVPFRVGEIEHVSTHPEFRRRGLVRRQTELMHEWSAAAGELVTAVNGIPWFYTRFGYTLPIDKYNGRRLMGEYARRISANEARYSVRAATADDIGFIDRVFAYGARRNCISYVRERDHWMYDLTRRDSRSRYASWRCDWLGEAHPAFRACSALFGPTETLGTPHRRGAWYVRIPHVPEFVSRVVPALERTLASSDEAGYSGRLSIAFYGDGGLSLTFDQGNIGVEQWKPSGLFDGDARFADGTFLELLFGRRDVRALEESHPYRVTVSARARPLLSALFPKGPSFMLPVY